MLFSRITLFNEENTILMFTNKPSLDINKLSTGFDGHAGHLVTHRNTNEQLSHEHNWGTLLKGANTVHLVDLDQFPEVGPFSLPEGAHTLTFDKVKAKLLRKTVFPAPFPSSITKMEVINCKLTSGPVFSKFLGGLHHVVHLNFSNNNLENVDIPRNAFFQDYKLKVLLLSENYISVIDCDPKKSKSLCLAPKLNTLDLTNNGIVILDKMNGLFDLPNLKKLVMKKNLFPGFYSNMKFFTRGALSVTWLCLENCNLSTNITEFSHFLSENKSLKYLSLSSNDILDFTSLGFALQENTTLLTLDISFNPVFAYDSFAELLLQGNHTLQTLCVPRSPDPATKDAMIKLLGRRLGMEVYVDGHYFYHKRTMKANKVKRNIFTLISSGRPVDLLRVMVKFLF